MKPTTCIGFGDLEGRCANKPGTRWTDLWCERCDAERRAHITQRLEAIEASLARRTEAPATAPEE